MDGWLLMVGYAAALAGLSMLGGSLSSFVRVTHLRMQAAMSCIAGLILGVALYHLLPHSLILVGGANGHEDGLRWTLFGVVFMVLLLRAFHFHQHDFSSLDEHCADADPSGAPSPRSPSWLGIALGLGLHTMVEGMALGASARAGAYGGNALLSGGVFLGIALHKPLDSLSVTAMMQAARFGVRARRFANVAFAGLCPAAALLAFWGVGLLAPGQEYIVGCALAFSAGALICISLSDLLPEIHFHGHDRGKLAACFLAGIGVAYALRWLEPASMHGA